MARDIKGKQGRGMSRILVNPMQNIAGVYFNSTWKLERPKSDGTVRWKYRQICLFRTRVIQNFANF